MPAVSWTAKVVDFINYGWVGTWQPVFLTFTLQEFIILIFKSTAAKQEAAARPQKTMHRITPGGGMMDRVMPVPRKR